MAKDFLIENTVLFMSNKEFGRKLINIGPRTV